MRHFTEVIKGCIAIYISMNGKDGGVEGIKTTKKKGVMVMGKNYPEYLDRLKVMTGRLSKELPGPLSGYIKLHKEVMTEGALSRKAKELIALAISITARCEGCIAFHVHDALQSGAARQEVLETIGVAILMGGGPSMIYGAEAMDALDQFEAKGTDA